MQEISFRDDILPLKDKLFRLALRITFNRAEAEDVVQETLIRVWNNAVRFSRSLLSDSGKEFGDRP